MPYIALILVLMLGCRAESPPPATGEAEPASSAGPQSTPQATETTPPAVAKAAAIDIPNAKMAAQGILVGGQPSIEQLDAAAQAGYRTIVNLRAPGEQGSWDEATKAADLGLRYVAIPISGADGLSAENARKLADIVDDPSALPAMVHCASGNRVGALFALKAHHVDGEAPENAIAIGLEAGLTKLEDAVRERLSPAG